MGTITYQGVSTSTSSGGSGAGGASDEELAAIALQVAEAEAEASAATAAAAAAQEAAANLSGEVAAKPSESAVRTIAQEEIAGEIDVVTGATGALSWDVSLHEGKRLEMTGDVTLTATNVATLLDLAGVLLLYTGTGTITFGAGFDTTAPAVADDSVQEMAFRREGSVLHLMNQPVGTVAGVDDGTASYTASEIAALEQRLEEAEAALASGVGTDRISRFALAASLGLYADTDAAAADLATMTDGVDYVVQEAAPDGSETAPLIIKNNYA